MRGGTNTEFDETEGPVELNACVKVDYAVQADGSYNAHQIESEPASDCNDDDNGNNGEDQKVYARVDAMPGAGLIGEWT